jgi:hypothetical protein
MDKEMEKASDKSRERYTWIGLGYDSIGTIRWDDLLG